MNIFKDLDTFQKSSTDVSVYPRGSTDRANEPDHAKSFLVPEACHDMVNDTFVHTPWPLNAKESLFMVLNQRNFRKEKPCWSYVEKCSKMSKSSVANEVPHDIHHGVTF